MVNEESIISSQEKFNLAQSIINHDGSLHVYFDPRGDDVLVPSNLKVNSRIALQFALNLPTPIKNFSLNEHGIGGGLSFSNMGAKSYDCWVPWTSVFCIMVSGTKLGKQWLNDLPNDDSLITSIEAKKNRLEFKVIDGGAKEYAINRDGWVKDFSHLKVIK